MQLHKTKYILPLVLLAVLYVLAACSTQKNTAQTRWWHSFNARYNTYYNATLSYIDGSLEKENGNKDNFTEMIPLYTVGNKQSKELGKGNFDKTVEKCQKAIKLHRIKKKPDWNKSRRKTERDLEWLSRKEYNPFLWKAWMLMGRAQFYKGDFDDAASTFAYMSRIYQTQPAIYGRARAWLAKTYIEEGWLYDAEDVMRNMQRDSIHWRAQKEWDYTYTDYYIHTHEYEKAIPYLKKVIKHEMRRKQKAREWYLLGQLYAEVGQKDLAYKAFNHVVKLNPPYEVEFNARIAMTEVMATSHSKQMISRLKRMAASDKNKDYLDQVYYAIGNIYMTQRDTASAIRAYEKGNAKATRSGIEKGVLLLRLGDIYWAKEMFKDAQRCYGEAIGLLDKERDDYEQLSRRSKMLDELVPYTDAVHLQDSLQALAKMSVEDRNAAIDRVIEALKKQEKEERNRQSEANAQQALQRNGGNPNVTTPATTPPGGNTAGGKWYFYNPMAVQQGKQTFEKQWGKRENVDDWQRINKTVVASLTGDSIDEAVRDSLEQLQAVKDSIEQKTDSAQNDPHKREYYLAQIPFTEEQVAASNLIIMDGLYNSGVIFKDKLNNLKLSEKSLMRLVNNYPDYESMDNAYYHLFLLYSRLDMPEIAENWLAKLKDEYPESQWTGILSDPYFKENAQFGVHIEDSLYAATYNAFKDGRYAEVSGNARISENRFPLGENRDKFLFINALSKLNNGDSEGCLADMKTIVEKFPQGPISQMAGMIVKGVQNGRMLRGGKFDIDDVWARRNVALSDSDSTAIREFTPDRNANFVYMIAYSPDSINENKLLFEMARYNFTSYLVRNFDISIENGDGIKRMMVSGFRNYDEALQYVHSLYEQQSIMEQMGSSRSIIISEPNLPLLGKQFSYEDYDAFYAEHFAPIKVSTEHLLTEPTELDYNREPTLVKPEDENTDEDDGNTVIDDGGTVIDDGGTVIDEGNTVIEDEGEGTVIDEGGTTPVDEGGSTVIDIPDEPAAPANETILEIEEPAAPVQQDEPGTIIIDDEPDDNGGTDEPEIYFDDPNTQPQNNNNKTEPTNNYDLEDEYYDLDGF